jgi:hypothetical protein
MGFVTAVPGRGARRFTRARRTSRSAPPALVQPFGPRATQVSASPVAARNDQVHSVTALRDILWCCNLHERPKVVGVLRPLAVVTRQELERHQETDRRQRDHDARNDFGPVRGGHKLLLDARRREQEVDQASKTFASRPADSCSTRARTR